VRAPFAALCRDERLGGIWLLQCCWLWGALLGGIGCCFGSFLLLLLPQWCNYRLLHQTEGFITETLFTVLACPVDVGGEYADLMKVGPHVFSLLFDDICRAHDELGQLGEKLIKVLLHVFAPDGQNYPER
jgi:hypothetical protein